MEKENIEKIVKEIENSFKNAPRHTYNSYEINLYSEKEENLLRIKKMLQSNHPHGGLNFSLSKVLYIDKGNIDYKLNITLNSIN